MGCFSFRRADRCTKQSNFVGLRDTMKLMIPMAFINHYGAGCLTGLNNAYGEMGVTRPDGKTAKLDVYGFLAYVNCDMVIPKGEYVGGKKLEADTRVGDLYVNTDDGWSDTCIQSNRDLGIKLGCYEKDMAKCVYPLKLCSPSYKGSYEELEYFSCGDSKQGCSAEYWDSPCGIGEILTVAEYCKANCRIPRQKFSISVHEYIHGTHTEHRHYPEAHLVTTCPNKVIQALLPDYDGCHIEITQAENLVYDGVLDGNVRID